MNVADTFVGVFSGCIIADQTVLNSSLAVDDHHILDSALSLIQQWYSHVVAQLIEVLGAENAVNAERHSGHDRLFLLNNDLRIALNRTEIYVVLNAQGEPQHYR